MVRYARSYTTGSKKPQEATPWSEMSNILKNDTKDRLKNRDSSREWPAGPKTHSFKRYKERTNFKGIGLSDFTFDAAENESESKPGLAAQLVSIAPAPPALEVEDVTVGDNKKKKKKKGEKELKANMDTKKKKLKKKNNTESSESSKEKKAKRKSTKQTVREKVEKIKKDHTVKLSKEDETQLEEFVKKDQRRENRRIKRIDEKQSSTICFNCRKSGHTIANCPEASKDLEQGTGICFKCGSTEHTVHQCRVKLPAGEYPYAKCFICNEMGHLSKQCPDNPRGLYPKGGCCMLCGSVEHYKKDCPVNHQQQGIDDMKLSVMSTVGSADEELAFNQAKYIPRRKGPKIVKF